MRSTVGAHAMIVGFVRHGRTAWNDAGRMQGRADIPLSDAGRAQVRRWQLPPALAAAAFVSSPLARARETAVLLGGPGIAVEDALVEMDWGTWEGHTLAALQAGHRAAFETASARGLHFRPPGGESPHDVQLRVLAWLAHLPPRDAVVAVTHQGVIRTLLAAVSGWTMTGKPPVRLADDVVHVADIAPGGTPRSVDWNVPLVPGPVGRRRADAAPGDRKPAPRARDYPDSAE